MNSLPPNKKTIIFGTLGLLVFLVVMIGYYSTHKPFTSEELLGLLILLWRLLVVFAIVSLSGGLGHKLLKGSQNQPVSNTIVQVALGLGCLGILVLVLGASLGFSVWLFMPLLFLGGILFRKSIVGWWSSWAGLGDIWSTSGRFGKIAIFFGAIILTTGLIISLAPPLYFDTLTYHLAIPRTYLLEGRLSYLPENMFWGMPQSIEMLNSLALSLGGLEAATLLGWAFAFLTLVGIFAYTKDRFGCNAAWVAVACLLVGQTLSASLAWGYVEWPSMLFATAMIIVMQDWLEKMESRRIILAGVLAGMALATKYTAGIVLLVGLVVIMSRLKPLGWQATLRTLLIFGMSAVLVFSPWLIKNALATGNPIYPLLFPSGAMDQVRLDYYQKSFGVRPIVELILLPWNATVWGVEGKVGFSASIGPLLLGLSLFSGLGWRERNKAQRAAILNVALITVSSLFIWAVSGQFVGYLTQSRLFFAFFPAWAILGGVGFNAIEKLTFEKVRLGRIASVLVLLVYGFAVFETGVNVDLQGARDVIFGHRSTGDYVTDHLGGYGLAMQSIREMPESNRVLMLWETRSLYCLPVCDPDEVIDRWIHDVRTYGTPEKILASWQAQGYTHMLLNQGGVKFIQQNETWIDPEEWSQLEKLIQLLPPPENFGESYSLYSLNKP